MPPKPLWSGPALPASKEGSAQSIGQPAIVSSAPIPVPLTSPNGRILPQLLSPTIVLGSRRIIQHPDADVLAAARYELTGRDYGQLAGWENPEMECYRNATLLMPFLFDRLMSFIQNHHVEVAQCLTYYTDVLLELHELWSTYQGADRDADGESANSDSTIRKGRGAATRHALDAAVTLFWNDVQDGEKTPQHIFVDDDFIEQQDAHEFLTLLLSAFKNQLTFPKVKMIEDQEQSFNTMVTMTMTVARRCPDCLYHNNVAHRYDNEDLDILNVPIGEDKKLNRTSTVRFEDLLALAVGKKTDYPQRCGRCYEKLRPFSDDKRKYYVWRKIGRLTEVLFTSLVKFRATGVITNPVEKISTRVVLGEEIDLERFREEKLRWEHTKYSWLGWSD